MTEVQFRLIRDNEIVGYLRINEGKVLLSAGGNFYEYDPTEYQNVFRFKHTEPLAPFTDKDGGEK